MEFTKFVPISADFALNYWQQKTETCRRTRNLKICLFFVASDFTIFLSFPRLLWNTVQCICINYTRLLCSWCWYCNYICECKFKWIFQSCTINKQLIGKVHMLAFSSYSIRNSKLKIVIEWVAKSQPYFTKFFHTGDPPLARFSLPRIPLLQFWLM